MMLCDAPEISHLYAAGMNMLTELMDLDPDDNEGFVNNIVIDYLCSIIIKHNDVYTIEVDDERYEIATYEELYDFIERWHADVTRANFASTPAPYKTKELPVTAIQYSGDNLNDVVNFSRPYAKVQLQDNHKVLFIEYSNRVQVNVSDYVVKDDAGSISVMKAARFKETYESDSIK